MFAVGLAVAVAALARRRLSGSTRGLSLKQLVQAAVDSSTERKLLVPLATSSTLVYSKGVPFLKSTLVAAANVGRLASAGRSGAPTDAFAAPNSAMIVKKFDRHTLILNKFPVISHHTVLFTTEFEPQSSLLTPEDFKPLWTCVTELNAMGFYNCGPFSGASQPRKHMQVLPLDGVFAAYPPSAELKQAPPIAAVIFAERQAALSSPGPKLASARTPFRLPLPFPHAVCVLGGDVCKAAPEAAAGLLAGAYKDLLASCEAQVGPLPSHNLVLTPTWMLVVPRFHNEGLGVAINSVGYAGLMLYKEGMDKEDPLDVLTAAATP